MAQPELTVGVEFEFLIDLTKLLSLSREEMDELKAAERPRKEMILEAGKFVRDRLQQAGSEYPLLFV